MNFKRIILAAFGGFAAYFITHAVAAQRISQIPSRVSFSESNQDRNADRNGCDVRGNASAGGDLRHALSRRLGLRGRRALRSPDRNFCGLFVCDSQLRQPRYRREINPRTVRGLLRGVDRHRHRDRPDLSAAREHVLNVPFLSPSVMVPGPAVVCRSRKKSGAGAPRDWSAENEQINSQAVGKITGCGADSGSSYFCGAQQAELSREISLRISGLRFKCFSVSLRILAVA
jgi:hypothetical protein